MSFFSCFKKKEKPQPTPAPISYDSLFEELIDRYRRIEIEAPKLKVITLAQWMLESGRATSKLAQDHKNFGGLKWRKEMSSIAKPVSYEAHDGRTEYCKFDSVDDFIRGYWMFIERYPYRGWRKYLDDPHGFMNHIVEAGYCPNPGYLGEVFNLEGEAERRLNG